MKHTNNQINKMAAEVLGKAFCSGSFDCDGVCYHCNKHESNNVHADFCADLNASQRLVKEVFNVHVAENTKSNRFADIIFSALRIEAVSLTNNPNLSNRDLVMLYNASAKTITLAALVAAGKISIEDAKESI